jgi:hypothetical protein
MRFSMTVRCLQAASCLTLASICAAVGGTVPASHEAAGVPDADGPEPFAYCARAGTDDRLGVPTTSESAGVLAPYTRDLGWPASASMTPTGIFWRCMDARVYVCVVGANLPCASKAGRAKRNRGAQSYCREHPDATDVPAYATGHETLYAWRCAAGRAVRSTAVAPIDRRGYRTDIWHPLSR